MAPAKKKTATAEKRAPLSRRRAPARGAASGDPKTPAELQDEIRAAAEGHLSEEVMYQAGRASRDNVFVSTIGMFIAGAAAISVLAAVGNPVLKRMQDENSEERKFFRGVKDVSKKAYNVLRENVKVPDLGGVWDSTRSFTNSALRRVLNTQNQMTLDAELAEQVANLADSFGDADHVLRLWRNMGVDAQQMAVDAVTQLNSPDNTVGVRTMALAYEMLKNKGVMDVAIGQLRDNLKNHKYPTDVDVLLKISTRVAARMAITLSQSNPVLESILKGGASLQLPLETRDYIGAALKRLGGDTQARGQLKTAVENVVLTTVVRAKGPGELDQFLHMFGDQLSRAAGVDLSTFVQVQPAQNPYNVYDQAGAAMLTPADENGTAAPASVPAIDAAVDSAYKKDITAVSVPVTHPVPPDETAANAAAHVAADASAGGTATDTVMRNIMNTVVYGPANQDPHVAMVASEQGQAAGQEQMMTQAILNGKSTVQPAPALPLNESDDDDATEPVVSPPPSPPPSLPPAPSPPPKRKAPSGKRARRAVDDGPAGKQAPRASGKRSQRSMEGAPSGKSGKHHGLPRPPQPEKKKRRAKYRGKKASIERGDSSGGRSAKQASRKQLLLKLQKLRARSLKLADKMNNKKLALKMQQELATTVGDQLGVPKSKMLKYLQGRAPSSALGMLKVETQKGALALK